MRLHAIQVGLAYTNGKGAIRYVVAAGPQFKERPDQKDADCIQFLVFEQGRGLDPKGTRTNCTRASFASWARAVEPVHGRFKLDPVSCVKLIHTHAADRPPETSCTSTNR